MSTKHFMSLRENPHHYQQAPIQLQLDRDGHYFGFSSTPQHSSITREVIQANLLHQIFLTVLSVNLKLSTRMRISIYLRNLTKPQPTKFKAEVEVEF